MGDYELLLELEELGTLVFECGNCGSSINVPLVLEGAIYSPTMCPGCGNHLHQASGAHQDYQRFFRAATAAATLDKKAGAFKVKFRIAVPPPANAGD